MCTREVSSLFVSIFAYHTKPCRVKRQDRGRTENSFCPIRCRICFYDNLPLVTRGGWVWLVTRGGWIWLVRGVSAVAQFAFTYTSVVGYG